MACATVKRAGPDGPVEAATVARDGNDGGFWWIYVLLCAHDRLYIGIAKNVDARFAAHRAGKGAIYTRLNPPVRILARQRHATRGDALRAEYALKQLSRVRKLAWIEACATRS